MAKASAGHDERTPMLRKHLLSGRLSSVFILRLLLTQLRVPFVQAQDAPEEMPTDATDSTTTRPVVVDIPELGRIQGKRQSGFDFFGGIPYAAPPVGTLRWAPPEPAAPWAPAKLDASHYGPDCWQLVDPLVNPSTDTRHMSEDCLYLNVFTPAGLSSQRHIKMPTMVFLHGGAFQQGGARRPEYDGRRLARRGTVVITLNYRLGALGFLVSSSDGLLGNFGLMDQRAALHWIKDNIQHFGGDPDNLTLFGESAGAVMTVLHLMMEGAGRLFHKVIIQSNPLGLQFRSVVVADFIGEALKRFVDCRDLSCLRSERVEEIMRAQSMLMGVPRSVGDFFTWGPTLTDELRLYLGPYSTKSERAPILDRNNELFRDLESWKWRINRDTAWAAVNVSQPLKHLDLIPDNVPVIIGTNKHEGEMFVHGAFPVTMSKAVYWMFVGALFRDSASRVLKHYRGYVDQIEKEAAEMARKRIEEEEAKHYYEEHQEEMQREYQMLLSVNSSKSEGAKTRGSTRIASVEKWTRGGALGDEHNEPDENHWHHRLWDCARNQSNFKKRQQSRHERRKQRAKQKLLKAAAKVIVDYRPVMSRIIDDYLFRCPSWHFAHKLSRNRLRRGHSNNVYVYQFSHSTHIPGYKECWGKSCHTAELPYVFQAMDIIRTNYSTLGPYAQQEAPKSPEYPYTDILKAYRQAVEAADQMDEKDHTPPINKQHNHTHSIRFQRILYHFFGDYFSEDADEETANDMADRWVSFARKGDPNYDESKATWRPWRFVFDEPKRQAKWWKQAEENDFRYIFNLDGVKDEDDIVNATSADGFYWSDIPAKRVYRRRMLKALGMEVAFEDVFQTILRRIPKTDNGPEHSLYSLLFGSLGRSSIKKGKNQNKQQRTRKVLQQLQQIAQEMGIMGTGLHGQCHDDDEDDEDEDFFPQILELKWPPEDRLIERDCTCDMWDRIRYRY